MRSQSSTESGNEILCQEINKTKTICKLTEAQEQRVDRHGVHTEENCGDEVGSEEDEKCLCDGVVEVNVGEMLSEQRTREIGECAGSHAEGDEKLRQEEQEIGRLVYGDRAENVSHQEVKGVFGTCQEVLAVDCSHDVSVAIHEPQEILQHPEAASAAAQDRPGEFVVKLLDLLVDVLDDQTNESADRDDERAKRKSPDVKTNCSIDGLREREVGNV